MICGAKNAKRGSREKWHKKCLEMVSGLKQPSKTYIVSIRLILLMIIMCLPDVFFYVESEYAVRIHF